MLFKDPNLPVALAIQEQFPTPQAVATASFSSLTALRMRNHPSNTQIAQLQQLASQSIGTKDVIRQRGLVLKQCQLIRELRLLQEHIQQLDTEIYKVVDQSGEGQILTSMGIGVIQAAAIISAIGTVLNFRKASELKSYFGWAPQRDQTGVTRDRDRLTRAGTRTMKQRMFLVVSNVIRHDTEWTKLYQRLVPKMCRYDESAQAFKGRIKVMSGVAGQMIEMMYALLRPDAEILSRVPPGEMRPDPIIYDSELHKRHRNGEYRPIKNAPRFRKVLQLPERMS